MGDPDHTLSEGFLRTVDAPVGSAGVYIHVPFCASRCTYCDFYSVGQGGALTSAGADRYIEALGRQIRAVCRDLPVLAETLYIGGGTPSLLGERIGDVVRLVISECGLMADAEVTVEANPDDLTAELLESWRTAGVTRVSVGVQALSDSVLKQFGRRHTAAEAVDALVLLADSGLRWSVDLIAGIPGVTDVMWLSWLQWVVAAGAHHLSVYPLTIEDGTALAARVDRGDYPEPDSDAAATQMLLAERELALHNIRRYEIANFAVPGEESRHNLSYWTSVPYIGLGPSAASMLPVQDGGRVRFTLHESLEEYLSDPVRGTSASPTTSPGELEILTAGESFREDVMLRLRTTEGVNSPLVERAGVAAVLNRLEDLGLVERIAGSAITRWHLTERGWLLGNEVFSSVLFD